MDSVLRRNKQFCALVTRQYPLQVPLCVGRSHVLEHAASIGRLRKGRLGEVVESPLAWFRLDVATVVEVVVALRTLSDANYDGLS